MTYHNTTRNTKQNTLVIRVTPTMHDAFRAHAKAKGTTMAAILRRHIKLELKRGRR